MSQWIPPNRMPPYGTPSGYSYSPCPVPPQPTSQQKEAKHLRKDANYTGLVMLALTAGMKLTYTVVVLVLCLAGILNFNDMNHATLGLDNTSYLLLYAFVYILAMAVPVVLVSICCRRRYFPLSPSKTVSAEVAFFGILTAMGACMVANFVTSYIVTFLEQYGVQAPEMPDMMENTPTSLFLNLVVMAVLPALLEEMVFRGYILRALRPYGDAFAVIVSSFLFGLMHGNIEQIPFALIVGVALGWLVVRTDNIWLAVAVHFCNNALSVLMQYFGELLPEQEVGVFNLITLLAVGLIGAASFAVLLVRRRELFSLNARRSILPASTRVVNLFLSPLLVIAVIVLLFFAVESAV